METTISIVLVHWAPDFVRARLAKESFDSLIASVQHLPVEITVVDNRGEVDCSSFFIARQDAGCLTTYIRNSTNVHFGYGRNQALRESSGEYLVVVDNDLLYTKGWLEKAIEALESYPGERLIASPMPYTDKRSVYKGQKLGKYETHQRAGSNCFVMRRKTWELLGPFKLHRVAGSLFTDALVRHGYRTILAGVGMVKDVGLRRGYNHRIDAVVEKPLLNGEVLTFSPTGDITRRYDLR